MPAKLWTAVAKIWIGEYRKNNALAYSERFFINLRFNHFLTGSS